MAFHRCLKNALWMDQSVLRRSMVIGSCNKSSPNIMRHNQVCWTKSHGYRKFSRTPIAVRPGRLDVGKKHTTDYVNETSHTVNEEVLEEARIIARLTQSDNAKNFVKSEASASHLDHSEEDHEDIEVIEKTNKDIKVPATSAATQPSQQRFLDNLDPDLRKAFHDIGAEFFERAPAVYRTLISKCSSTKLRDANDLVMMEGPKLIQEALTAGLAPVALYYSRKKTLLQMMPRHMTLREKVEHLNSYKIFTTSYRKLNAWSSVVQGQGLLGVFKLADVSNAPRLRLQDAAQEAKRDMGPMSRVTVVLDGVREPGNLGAILRTVAAVGAPNVALIKGCCDPWEGKALRAGCGGHFSLNITRDVTWDSVYNAVPHFPTVYVADICNNDRDPMRDDQDEDEENEQSQLSEDCSHRGRYSAKDDIRARATRYFQDLPTSADCDPAGSDAEATTIVFEVDEDGKELRFDYSFNDEKIISRYTNVQLPTKHFNDVNFYASCDGAEDVVLVIGGESGLSNCAKKFTEDNYGTQVSIPLNNNVDSLNTSVASGIILYQIWDQAQKVKQNSRAAKPIQVLDSQ